MGLRFASYLNDGCTLVHPETIAWQKSVPMSSFTALSKLDDFVSPPLKTTYPYSKKLRDDLQSKLLLLDELPYSIETIHDHYLNGYIGYMKPIVQKSDLYCCQRCRNHEQRLFAAFKCARCDQECMYCRKCILMGRVSECTPLLYWRGPVSTLQARQYSTQWAGELSKQQHAAAQRAKEIIGKPQQLLIWAVAGAGKTEILFASLEKAFAAGMRVCLATPRIDVVLELAPRFKQAFPHVEMSVLYGDSLEENKEAQLVLATTHQLLRFRHWFDVMIVDEVDAFPYSIDAMLAFAVARAKKRNGSLLYLTATPSVRFKQKINEGKLPFVKIPARYHGYPLPVPVSKWCGNWPKALQKKKLPTSILTWCAERIDARKQFFLFVPSVRVLHEVETILKLTFSNVASVHAQDPDRKQKVTEFRQGKTQLLITTTILERGVTVPNIDVGVIGAEAHIFTESALVQIAGRVGRSAEFPQGDILFFHYGKTEAINAAIGQIQTMNREAKDFRL